MEKENTAPSNQSTNPKRKYEPPNIQPLEAMGNVKLAAATCSNGSGDLTVCSSGNGSPASCNAGAGN